MRIEFHKLVASDIAHHGLLRSEPLLNRRYATTITGARLSPALERPG
jgi:hypothetical protein